MTQHLEDYDHIIFSDGSALGNPGPGGYGAIILFRGGNVQELGGHEGHTTNNKMELRGVLESLMRMSHEHGNILCCSDSQYVINAVTKWIHGWKKNNWTTTAKKPVENRDLLERIDACIQEHNTKGKIDFRYVPGHVGVAGNERCDEIATTFARNEHPILFDGTLSDYAVDILNIGTHSNAESKKTQKKSRSGKAYAYLSLVDGVAQTHTTWDACEKRVKGKSGVKYKKAMTKEEQEEILHTWGVSL